MTEINNLNEDIEQESISKPKRGRPKGSKNSPTKKKRKAAKTTRKRKTAATEDSNAEGKRRKSSSTDRITIKDIAEKAGVSVGTVDRVLHERPNVSPTALTKVRKALEEMKYEPNMYASALANSRQYHFHCLMPKHESEAYWEEVEEGQKKACEVRRDFNVKIHIHYYKRNDWDTFTEEYKKVLDADVDGVILVPSRLEMTRQFTDILHEREIPFVMLDSYMPDLRPLAFYGQDSFASGYFAARMLSLIAHGEKQIMLMKQTLDGLAVASKQQDNREVGFRHYMRDHFPNVEILEVDLPYGGTKKEYNTILDKFFKENPNIHHCITMNSKAHLVGEYILKNNRRDVQIMGYDMVGKNAKCLRQGSISFLIAQHGYMQGYYGVDALVRAIILKKDVEPVNYMPIEILTKENVDFYRRTQT
ncbi:MAG: LacI family DNA-binding transcriptional regulator [Prevotella sp.]|nr:LacI family DNA-binding transcriptional regulator [Prevotella sp.]